MTDLHVICRRQAVGILSRTTYTLLSALELRSIQHRTICISICGEVWNKSVSITNTFVELTKDNIKWKNIIKNIAVNEVKQLLSRVWCITKHK
jgi:hypothetical protein